MWKKSYNWVFWGLIIAATIWSLRLLSLDAILSLSPFFVLSLIFSLLRLKKESLVLGKKVIFPFLAAISFPLALTAPFYFIFFALLLPQLFVFWERNLPWSDFSNSFLEEFLPVSLVYLAFHILSPIGWLADTPSLLAFLLLIIFFLARLIFQAISNLPSSNYSFSAYCRYEFDFSGRDLIFSLLLGYLFYLLFLDYRFLSSIVYLLYLPYLFLWINNNQLTKENEEFLLAIYYSIKTSDSGLSEQIDRVKNLVSKIGFSLGLPLHSIFNLILSSGLVHLAEISLDRFSLESFLERDNEEEGVPYHARLGAKVLESATSTRKLAQIVYNHHRPFFLHKSRVREEGSLPLEARIIFLASAFDELVHDSRNPLRPEEAWRTIQKDQGFLYDPKLVRQLRKVLEEEGFFRFRKSID